MRKDTKLFYIQTSINNDIDSFRKLGFLSPKSHTPEWVLRNDEIFLAYLAGMIDGDGNICIKRPAYPQCRITITSEFMLPKLKQYIEKFLSCKVSYYKYKNRNAYNLDFYISPKNFRLTKEKLYPNLTINHKRQVLNNFLIHNLYQHSNNNILWKPRRLLST
jgi:intein/homing endonuclease